MDELNRLDIEIADGPTTNVQGSLDPATMKSCLDFLFQAAVDRRLPLVASLIGAASDALSDEFRRNGVAS